MCYTDPMRSLLLILLASTASAEGFSGYGTDCYCTDADRNRVEMGEQRCLTISGRSFLAECQMSQNVPMWREIGDVCPLSSQNPHPSIYARLVNAKVRFSVNQMTVQDKRIIR